MSERAAATGFSLTRTSSLVTALLALATVTLPPVGPMRTLAEDEKKATKVAETEETEETKTGSEPKWRLLFDGKSLEKWKITQFGGQGEVRVEESLMILEQGASLTGVTYEGEIPRTNYEVELQARRQKGIDFFCGFTFPVGDSYCSFIVGGWAGGIVGLSSIDGQDASENETTRFMSFKTGQWYRIRVRVTDDVIQAWIDDESVVYQRIRGRKISTRVEVDLSQPFGFSSYETSAALKDIRIRELSVEEIEQDKLP